jgi:hypothetical protein
MTQDWKRDDSQHEKTEADRRDRSIGEQAFGRDQSMGEGSGRPAGGWQDPDRGYSEEARGHHTGQDSWAGGQHRAGNGGEVSGGYGRGPAASQYGSGAGGSREGMGGHDPYGQHGLGQQHYGEHRHPEGQYRGLPGQQPRGGGYGQQRGEQGGIGRQQGGEPYAGREQQRFGQQGQTGHDGRHEDQGFHPEYARWRSEQISKLDEDYRAWCKERQGKFNDEFESWRKGRGGPQGQGAITMSNSSGKTGVQDDPDGDSSAPLSGSAQGGSGSSQSGGSPENKMEDQKR